MTPLARRITHTGVYATIEAGERLLMVKKARGPYTGAWDLPGGAVEWGESWEDALRREVREETGLTLEDAPPRLVSAWSHIETWTPPGASEPEALHHRGLIYRANTAEDGELAAPREAPDGEDANGAEWLPISALGDLALTPFARRAVNCLLAAE